jgi:hypothetical protein
VHLYTVQLLVRMVVGQQHEFSFGDVHDLEIGFLGILKVTGLSQKPIAYIDFRRSL